MGHFLVELNALDPQRKPNIATTLNPVRWIALGRTGATGHLVQRLVVQATRYVPGTRIQHAMVERNAQDPRTKTDHATQAHARWIALGQTGVAGQDVQGHVVPAHRDVGEGQIQHSMVERNAQDPQMNADCATHVDV